MFRYEQGSGRFLHGSGDSFRLIATGYAGAQACLNDPAKDHIHQCGPIPKGSYRLRVLEHPRFAAPAIYCAPEKGTRLHGRSGFYIHGDNRRGDRSASSGCIILGKSTRSYVARWIAEGDDKLVVLAGDDGEAPVQPGGPAGHLSGASLDDYAVSVVEPAALRALRSYIARA